MSAMEGTTNRGKYGFEGLVVDAVVFGIDFDECVALSKNQVRVKRQNFSDIPLR